MEQSKLKKGFTLIEIVIVLAIAALIMVVVFVAVQGAQRSQRDQARKDIAGRTLAAVQSYRGNNNGGAPLNAAALTNYVGNLSLGGLTFTLDNATATPTTAPTCTNATGTSAVVYFIAANKDSVAICLETNTGTAYTVTN